MKCGLHVALILAGLHPLGVAQGPVRPPITALDHVTLYAQDPEKSEAFYVNTLHARRIVDLAHPGAARYYFNSLQYVEIVPLPPSAGDSRLASVGFATSDAEALRAFLAAHGRIGTAITRGSYTLRDPEENAIVFSQVQSGSPVECFSDVSCHMIHAGFLVRNRAMEDHFYKDVLGFRPYWQGAMAAGKVDWVSQQVTNGSEWLEYMMTGPTSDHPSPAVTRAELGGMDHVSLVVENMEATVTKLLKEHRLDGKYAGPQMGRDGKWQTNLYDPDGTRIELMEATPSMEPCCSPYQAAHPGRRPISD